ncbi:helix-turn-helix domain-containing protein [Brachybacterium muris]|uniref:helix-turn-helix domain-containing protein n=1 Tax=Brachybacterium muris TaxID=219301 RepID=UPI003B96995D
MRHPLGCDRRLSHPGRLWVTPSSANARPRASPPRRSATPTRAGPQLEGDQIRSVRAAVPAGTPEAEIAGEHGVSRSTLYRYLEQPMRPLA